jgi:hypothetical protein
MMPPVWLQIAHLLIADLFWILRVPTCCLKSEVADLYLTGKPKMSMGSQALAHHHQLLVCELAWPLGSPFHSIRSTTCEIAALSSRIGTSIAI